MKNTIIKFNKMKNTIIKFNKMEKKFGGVFENLDLDFQTNEDYICFVLSLDALLCDSDIYFKLIENPFTVNNKMIEGINSKLPLEIIQRIYSYTPCYFSFFSGFKNCLKNKKSENWFKEKNLKGEEYGSFWKYWKYRRNENNEILTLNFKERENVYEDFKKENLDCKFSEYKPLQEISDVFDDNKIFKISYEFVVRRINTQVKVKTCFCDSLLVKKIMENYFIDLKKCQFFINKIGDEFFQNS